MVARAYGKAFSEEEIRDVYSAAWTATLSALRVRGDAMSDDELRSYILTAVASHASKEIRRRARKPAGSFDDAQEGAVSDTERPTPEEQAIGTEQGGIARDLLASLPPRRRAVMLLRYGWGLRPQEVCELVSGLSARAYRKEVTRGVAELIERLDQVESGEWCRSREPLIRDYVAGTADEATRLQVIEHLRHCRACSSLAANLDEHLHEIGALAAVLATVAGPSHFGAATASILDRILAAWHGLRAGLGEKLDQASVAVGNVASSGAFRGSGAAGAGVAAKLAGFGGAGKAGLACLGVTAAAGACVATGVVPSPPIRDLLPATHRADAEDQDARAERAAGSATAPAAVGLGRGDLPAALSTSSPRDEGSPATEQAREPLPDPVEEPQLPAATPPAAVEFDPVAAAPTTASAPSQSSPQPSAANGTSGGTSSVAGEEFGP
jgi:RNA polymerase sigma factor (sigma-70 family)